MSNWKHTYTCENCFNKHVMRIVDYETEALRGLVVCPTCKVFAPRRKTRPGMRRFGSENASTQAGRLEG